MAEASSRREAQRQADRIRLFGEELAALERQGVLRLTEEQRAAVEAHQRETLARLAAQFDVDTTDSQKQFSWGMRIASTLGALALCAALVLFFQHYWGLLGTATQVTILTLTPLLLVVGAEYAARRERTLYYTSLLCLVALASFILNVSALGSLFNLTPSKEAVLACGLFALALAYGYRLALPLAAALICLLVYAAASVAAATGAWWSSAFMRPETFLPGAAALVCVPQLKAHGRWADFAMVYRVLGLLGLYLPVLALSEAGMGSYLPLGETAVKSLYQVVSFLLAAGGIWWGIRLQRGSLVNLSAVYFAVLLYLRFYHWLWDLLPGHVFFLLLGMVSVGLLVLLRRLRKAGGE